VAIVAPDNQDASEDWWVATGFNYTCRMQGMVFVKYRKIKDRYYDGGNSSCSLAGRVAHI
jgi:hypothetical protein